MPKDEIRQQREFIPRLHSGPEDALNAPNGQAFGAVRGDDPGTEDSNRTIAEF